MDAWSVRKPPAWHDNQRRIHSPKPVQPLRIHALPTSWQGAAMEDNLNAIIVGIAEDVFILLK